jgi:beta-glucanase (GH16 family)
LHYGKVTFELKAASTAGAITSAIFMAPGGDEIDFEMLGGKSIDAYYFFSCTLKLTLFIR